jgi:predicted nucleic acid-binding Zn ribbon protein
MRKRQTQSISEIIESIVKAEGLGEKIAEARIIKGWHELLGKSISRLTKGIYIKNRVLFINLTSSVARNELIMIKPELLKRLNDFAGMQIINDIIIR